MRILFMGTPDWAVPTLEVLVDSDYEVCAVLTQPDRPAGTVSNTHLTLPTKAKV